MSAANLRAFNYGLKGERDPAIFKKVVQGMDVPEFKPRSGVKIQISETDPVQQGGDDGELSSLSACIGLRANSSR